jgi:hypothetical protein
MKKHILLSGALLTLLNAACTNAMETNPNARISYYQDQAITKELVLSKVGPQAPKEVHESAENIIKNNPELIELLKLPIKLQRKELMELAEKRSKLPDLSFMHNAKKYGLWSASPFNKAITLWHGDDKTKGIDVWKTENGVPVNRTDENYGKITVVDSCQTISAEACFLAMLAAYKQVPEEHRKYVKILPVYLHNVYGEEESKNKTTDESYVVIHRTLSTAVKLADNTSVIASIPKEAISSLYTMIMDNKSGAAGALWNNSGITVELDNQKNFKRWVIGLKEKPNNQCPQDFFNRHASFHENCQYVGLQELASVLNKSENKTALLTLQELVNNDKSIPETSGRFNSLKKELAQLVEKKS